MGVPPKENLSKKRFGRGWQRLALAIPLSILLHLSVVLFTRPDYRGVVDNAIDLEVVDVRPGPPPKASPPPEPEPAEEPAPEPEPKPEPEPVPKPKRKPSKSAVAKAEPPPVEEPKDLSLSETTGVEDAGVADGEGTGICMHDLFAYESANPTWVLYVSLSSFRETRYQKGLGDTFASFEIGRQLQTLTGLTPSDDVESMLVYAEDIFDTGSFRVVASYDVGEEQVRRRMNRRLTKDGVSWTETDQGYEAALPGAFRWHLVGSGRVLAITPEASAPVKTKPAGPVSKAGDGPARPTGTASQGRDAGVKDAGSVPPPPKFVPSSFPHWPKNVGCLSAQKGKKKNILQKTDGVDRLLTWTRAQLEPDTEGHWPVAVLSTTDPRAVGIGSRNGARLGFQSAKIFGFFTDPVRLEGRLHFSGDQKQIEQQVAVWKTNIARIASKLSFGVPGLAGVFQNLSLETKGTDVVFRIQMEERQVLALLFLLQLQGKSLERQLKDQR